MNEGLLQFWHGVLFRQRPDSTFEWISPRIEEWTGLEPRLALEAVHPNDRSRVGEARATFRLRHARTRRITWVQQRRRATAGGGHEGYWEDITENVQLKHRLAQGQWAATLGAATNKLVHDFNNLLTGILSLSDAYLTQIKPDNPAHEGLKLVSQNAHQAAEMVMQISRLFREVPGQRSYQNLSELVASAGEMLKKVLPRHTPIKVQAAPDSIPIYVDAVELKQVVVSLALASEGPIALESRLEKANEASLQIISSSVIGESPAALHARAFAERNEAAFSCGPSVFTLRFRVADFSEADKEATRPRSILLVGNGSGTMFETADFLRQNGFEAVIGDADLLDSLDYRFDAVWVRIEKADPQAAAILGAARKDYPRVRRVLELAGPPEKTGSLLLDADVTFSMGTNRQDMLARLRDALKS